MAGFASHPRNSGFVGPITSAIRAVLDLMNPSPAAIVSNSVR